MQCTIPVSLINRGMLLQELLPAIALFACAIGLAFYGGLEPKKKAFGIVLLCVIGLATSASTALLSLRSKAVVEGDTAILYAGFWKAELPLAALVDANATDQIGASLRTRTNGMSSRGVNAGWFQDASGRRIFAMSSGPKRVLVPMAGEFSVVLDQSTYDALKHCGGPSSSR